MNYALRLICHKFVECFVSAGTSFESVVVTNDYAARIHLVIKESDRVARRFVEVDINMHKGEAAICDFMKALGDPSLVQASLRESPEVPIDDVRCN